MREDLICSWRKNNRSETNSIFIGSIISYLLDKEKKEKHRHLHPPSRRSIHTLLLQFEQSSDRICVSKDLLILSSRRTIHRTQSMCLLLDSCIRMEHLITLTLISVLLLGYHSRLSQENSNIAYNIPDPGKFIGDMALSFVIIRLECTGVFNLCTDLDKERLGREAIRAIHEQMDDDKDGMIETSESTDVSSLLLSIESLMMRFSLSKKNSNPKLTLFVIDNSKM